ncbi:MAG: type II secretion system F family protein [Candidatus Aureabacteria bacterium]|nr:type II secretion system F family protein [Candidatus Auribacterota bacterium]
MAHSQYFIMYLVLFATLISVIIFIYGAWKIIQMPYGKYEERYLQVASGKLNQMFVFLPPEAVLYLKFSALFFGFLIFYYIFSGVQFKIVQYVVAITASICGFFLPEWIMNMMQNKRLNKFELQLVEGLTTLSNSLKAGFSFPQALDLLVKEGTPPISQEFGLVLKENKLGVSLEDALVNLTRRVASEDLDLVVTSVVLTRELGGNLSTIFERLAHTIRERLKLKGKIQALTSQGIMQGWVVGLMPVGLGVMISVISPDMMDAFLASIVGWILIGLIIILEVIGAFVIKKIVTIDI